MRSLIVTASVNRLSIDKSRSSIAISVTICSIIATFECNWQFGSKRRGVLTHGYQVNIDAFGTRHLNSISSSNFLNFRSSYRHWYEQTSQVWGHPPEQRVAAFTLYSLGLRLAIAQADARPAIPLSVRKDSTWRKHEACGRPLGMVQPLGYMDRDWISICASFGNFI